jgi:hypothetical protein
MRDFLCGACSYLMRASWQCSLAAHLSSRGLPPIQDLLLDKALIPICNCKLGLNSRLAFFHSPIFLLVSGRRAFWFIRNAWVRLGLILLQGLACISCHNVLMTYKYFVCVEKSERFLVFWAKLLRLHRTTAAWPKKALQQYSSTSLCSAFTTLFLTVRSNHQFLSCGVSRKKWRGSKNFKYVLSFINFILPVKLMLAP